MSKKIAKAYHELVELRYQLYDGLFTTLPLDAVQRTGVWLPLIQESCEAGLNAGLSPEEIITEFFSTRLPELSEQDQIDFLFKIIQYVERQIVLIDALEDSAYDQIHHVDGPDTWHQMTERLKLETAGDEIARYITGLGVRTVLTAHPTQFYPQTVLAIISDLTEAISSNKTAHIRELLEQLGRTPFFRKRKPTPLDEAVLLISHLKQVFYPAIGELLDSVAASCANGEIQNEELIRLGFWPGGDRDGNPNVNVEITLQVAEALRRAILECYNEDLKDLTRRLSFAGVHDRLLDLQERVEGELSRTPGQEPLQVSQFRNELEEIGELLKSRHEGLFLDRLESFQRKVSCFGFYFASLDLRQDSRIVAQTISALWELDPDLLPTDFRELPEREQIDLLMTVKRPVDIRQLQDPVQRDTAASTALLKDIQQSNGEAGAHRYIISNCSSALDMAKLYALIRLCSDWKKDLNIDLVPLFETIDDLKTAAEAMQLLYQNEHYREHLKQRANRQTIMLGFSDGTKDGGYLMANWAIYRAKEALTRVSREAGIEVYFFDGRGGPPARGGGNTHMFYTSLGQSIENKQLQTTLQGQTISSLYGTEAAAKHNLELLLTAGLKNKLRGHRDQDMTTDQLALIDEMAERSHQSYLDFRAHPLFIPYLLERSPLQYYGQTNIASRPSKRSQSQEFNFEDLRAIPFVGAWSQLKQNVPGYFGFGTALQDIEKQGRLDEVRHLYQQVDFFRAIVTNSMQSMSKSNFALTRYMASDERFGGFWKLIHAEFELTREMVMKVSGVKVLLEDNARSRKSIALREKVVLPLLTIQQYALMRLQRDDTELGPLYDKIVIRSLFGNINATRNSV